MTGVARGCRGLVVAEPRVPPSALPQGAEGPLDPIWTRVPWPQAPMPRPGGAQADQATTDFRARRLGYVSSSVNRLCSGRHPRAGVSAGATARPGAPSGLGDAACCCLIVYGDEDRVGQ
jgi:hypothetical protein